MGSTALLRPRGLNNQVSLGERAIGRVAGHHFPGSQPLRKTSNGETQSQRVQEAQEGAESRVEIFRKDPIKVFTGRCCSHCELRYVFLCAHRLCENSEKSSCLSIVNGSRKSPSSRNCLSNVRRMSF